MVVACGPELQACHPALKSVYNYKTDLQFKESLSAQDDGGIRTNSGGYLAQVSVAFVPLWGPCGVSIYLSIPGSVTRTAPIDQSE
jgi:hypothetical protein